MADKKPRRGRGEGTLEPRGKDTWRLRVYIGRDPVTGHPRQVSRTIQAASKTEALKELRTLAGEVDQGRHRGTRTVVSTLLAEYDKHHFPDLRDTTAQDYRRIIKKHLDPGLGTLELRKLTAHDIDSYMTKKRAAGYKPRTIVLHRSVLSGALDMAVDWGWIGANPATSSHPPKLDTPIRFRPEVDQVRALIEAAGNDRELATAVMLASITGCRRGELCGLMWPDIDWETGVLTVARQRVPVLGGDQTAPLKQKEPDWSKRISLGPLGVAVVQRYRQWTIERAGELNIEPRWDGWLLSLNCGRDPLNARSLGMQISDLGRRTGVPVTPHAFRRFAATQMVAAGVDVMTAASRLGHDPKVMLKAYAAALPVRDRAAAVGLEALVLAPVDKEVASEAH